MQSGAQKEANQINRRPLKILLQYSEAFIKILSVSKMVVVH